MKQKMKKKLDKPQKIRTSIEELEVLARLKGTIEWAIAKRIAGRYISNLRRKAFKLNESHPNFKLEHTDYRGQARGIKTFISRIENAGKERGKRKK